MTANRLLLLRASPQVREGEARSPNVEVGKAGTQLCVCMCVRESLSAYVCLFGCLLCRCVCGKVCVFVCVDVCVGRLVCVCVCVDVCVGRSVCVCQSGPYGSGCAVAKQLTLLSDRMTALQRLI